MKLDTENSTLETPLWDAIIVGAGVAGGTAAALLSEQGWRVLLLEKKEWPRAKACGGCLNAAGVRLLHAARLEKVLQDAGHLTHMDLRAGMRRMGIRLPAGAVVERQILDARLVKTAVERGTVFAANATARLLPEDNADSRAVRISIGNQNYLVRGRVILACDGLGKTGTGFLAEESWARVRMTPAGRLGFAATLEEAGSEITDGILTMCVEKHGYVGCVALPTEDKAKIHLGAALLPAACHHHGGPGPVIADILRASGLKDAPLFSALDGAAFVGTGLLTRQREIVGHGRVLAIGDACGYVEPFTGEGMCWAIRGAIAAAELLPKNPENIDATIGAAWRRKFAINVRQRQDWCRGLREVIGRNHLAAFGVGVAQHFPRSIERLARHISAG